MPIKTVWFVPVAIAVCVLTLACGQPAVAPTQTATKVAIEKVVVDAPLIPRKILWGNPKKVQPRLSPDGSKMAFIAPVDGVMNVWVCPADDMTVAKPVTDDKKRGIRAYFWSYTNDHIVYIQDKDGDENWHVYAVELQNNKTTDLTPMEGVRAQISGVSHLFPEEILVGLNDRNPQLHDLYRVNLVTAKRELILENPGFVSMTADDNYAVRFGTLMTAVGGSEIFVPAPDLPKKIQNKEKPTEGWESFMTIGMEDSLTTSPIDFDKAGENLYLLDSRDRNTAALFVMNLKDGSKKLVLEDARADLSGIKINQIDKTLQAATFTYDRKQWKFLDKEFESDFSAVEKVTDGDVNIVSRTLNDRIWLIAFVQDNGPVKYYRFNRDDKKSDFLFVHRPELKDAPLVKMYPQIIESRDGLKLVNYLSLPPGVDEDGDGRPDKPIPMVLNVHGGPWARVSWGFNPIHQWLANRGYAVLDVNFRGSTGFGKGFLNAGNKEWAGKMHDDLIDAVNWAIEQKIAIPEQIAIMGGSYGGYATLVGLTFTPDIFACGVDIVGPSNIVTLLNSIPPYWAPMLSLFTSRVGNHKTDKGKAFLKQRSPLTHVDKIKKPLLIGQGANDPRVKQAESDQIVAAMKKKNIPVTYVLYSDEGHGFARPENRLSFFGVTEAFLSQCLGGRYEPAGDDFEGSTIAVPEGAEHVPGLSQVLQ